MRKLWVPGVCGEAVIRVGAMPGMDDMTRSYTVGQQRLDHQADDGLVLVGDNDVAADEAGGGASRQRSLPAATRVSHSHSTDPPGERLMSLSVREYLSRAKDQTVPPLVLELILRSGKSFYIKKVFAFDEKAEMLPLRVWDVRAFAQADLDTVLRRLSAVQSRDELENIERLHPKLDEGNLWVLVSEIEAIVEWHSDLWPGVDRPEARQVIVGFRP